MTSRRKDDEPMAGPADTHDKPGIAAEPLHDTFRVVRLFLDASIEEEELTHEALAKFMTERGCSIDRPYLSAMLAGTRGKPITLRHLVAMPAGVVRRFSKKLAQFSGHIVVWPTSGDVAVEQFVTGLFGVLLGSRLSDVRPAMAKATNHQATARAVNE